MKSSAPGNDTILEVKNIRKNLGGKIILSNVSFSARQGEIIGISGPIGAGKSTLLYILTGLLEPNGGSVRISGRSLDQNRRDIAQIINYASSSQRLSGYATVSENLATYARLYGITNYRYVISSLWKTCVMSEALLNRKVFKLSAGENSFVNFTKALLNSPKILFLDEITSHMDPVLADRIRKYIMRRSQDTTTILVSQNLAELKRMCGRALILRQGKIVYDGLPITGPSAKSYYE